MSKFCANCGNPISEKNKFCSKCGIPQNKKGLQSPPETSLKNITSNLTYTSQSSKTIHRTGQEQNTTDRLSFSPKSMAESERKITSPPAFTSKKTSDNLVTKKKHCF